VLEKKPRFLSNVYSQAKHQASPMIILNSLFPVFGLLILGGMLKRWKLTNDVYLKTSDKLIYFIFFPIMLFWKIVMVGFTCLLSQR
jgi:hypothetical protein